MLSNEPAWWYGAGHQALALSLEPLARVYGAVAVARFKMAKPYRCKLPVICVGNFTAGGTGKTPLCIYLAERLKALGERPVFLTRGYGGSAKGPLWVDEESHTAAVTGDEPLLLARTAPTLVARDRRAGAQVIEARAVETRGAGASVIIMDDGMQNPSLVKDLSIAVLSAKRGLGNGRVIPAGPLRAPFKFQLELCDAIAINDSDASGGPVAGAQSVEAVLRQNFNGPMLRAHVVATEDMAWVCGARVLAFAGIGNPQRFFDLLAGAEFLECVVLRDHQMLSDIDARGLLAKAVASGAKLITTEKDWVRLSSASGPLAELKNKAHILPVRAQLDEASVAALDQLIAKMLLKHRQDKVSGF